MRAKGRLRVAPGQLRSDQVQLDADELEHLKVRRLRVGDHVQLLDGAGESALAEIRALSVDRCELQVLERHVGQGESQLRVCLVQALPVKLPRMETVIRQATELGVDRIVPVITERGQLPGGGMESVRRRAARWVRVAESAAKQCGRSVVPDVTETTAFAQLDLRALPAPHLLLDPEAEAGSLAKVIAGPAAPEATLIVGPEGGWSETETLRAAAAGAVALRLGPRVLRADSAAAVALALLQAAWGDLAR